MIDALIFDQGNVLVDYDPEKILLRYGYFGSFLKELKKAIFDTPLWAQLDLGQRSNDEIIYEMKQNSPKLSEEIDRFFSELDILCYPYDYAEPLLKSVHDHGFQIYILSNYNASFFDRDRMGYTFLNYCDGIVISGQEKIVKPDLEIYQRMIQRFDIDPAHSAFIDDSIVNCKAAESLGFKTIQVNTPSDICAGLQNLTDISFYDCLSDTSA